MTIRPGAYMYPLHVANRFTSPSRSHPLIHFNSLANSYAVPFITRPKTIHTPFIPRSIGISFIAQTVHTPNLNHSYPISYCNRLSPEPISYSPQKEIYFETSYRVCTPPSSRGAAGCGAADHLQQRPHQRQYQLLGDRRRFRGQR